IRHNPITGLGSGGFIRNFDKYYTGGVCPVRCHPHNDYLNILVESGILGFLVYVGLFLIFFKTAFYTYRIGKDLWKGIALGSIIAITGIMVAGLFECYFVDDEVEELIFFIFGLNSIAYFNVNNPRKILREPIKVLLVRTDRIGDLILSTPVAELLKKYNQLLNIDFLVSEYSSPVLKNNPYVNNVYIKKGFFETIRVIRSVNPRVVIFIRPKLDEAIAGFISGVFLRVGTGYRIYSFLYNLRHYEHRKENLYHEAIYNCHLLRVLGLEWVPDRIVFYLSDDDRVSASKILQDLWLKDDFVVLHPGGSGSSLLWSPGKFGELARIFVRMGMRVLVTGTRSEFHIAEEIVDIAGKFSYNLAGKTDLLTLAAIFEKSLIVITNSTGPLHIADSVGAKVLGIFPPTLSMSPSRWGPYNQKENIIVPPVQQCEKCVKDKCKYWFCMDMLKPETVFEKAIEIVKISRG
ncbi:MAG: glycosyltransferase family 9 protein, partial [bacterium]